MRAKSAECSPIIVARGLSKHYGPVTALDNVDLEIYPGEILAIVGDNGAGKSTLVKILSGAIAPDSGEVVINSVPVTLDSPQTARGYGIETVYQDLALAPNRDVVQNLYLGRELCYGGMLKPFGILNTQEMRRIAEQHLKQLEVGLPRLWGPVGILVVQSPLHGRAYRRAGCTRGPSGAAPDPAYCRERHRRRSH
jgi:ABC-type sugar transport system ATPase subunit